MADSADFFSGFCPETIGTYCKKHCSVSLETSQCFSGNIAVFFRKHYSVFLKPTNSPSSNIT